MRATGSWLAAFVAVSEIAAAGSAAAATVTLTGGTLTISISTYPSVSLPANAPGSFTLTASGGFTEPAGVFGPATHALPRELFTGVPQISGLTLGGGSNRTVAVTCAGADCVGTGGLTGSVVANVLQLLNLTIPLTPVGREGASAPPNEIIFLVSGHGWTSGTAAVSAVTTTTPGTTVLHTVTRMGSDARTARGGGSITLVSGFRMVTDVSGTWAGFATQTLRFAAVPEPGTLLLLGAGATALALLGRRRLRR